jgi:hypothetical protein
VRASYFDDQAVAALATTYPAPTAAARAEDAVPVQQGGQP